MSRYFAEVKDGIVQRVLVCDSPEWLSERLGGTWVETADPYADAQEVNYCGPGWGHDDTFPERFAPQWVQPVATTDGWTWYAKDQLVFHNGRIWRSTLDQNVWEPGVSGWHDAPVDEIPMWVRPTGAHDVYNVGDQVTHNGKTWESTTPNNVWEPGVFGWRLIDG